MENILRPQLVINSASKFPQELQDTGDFQQLKLVIFSIIPSLQMCWIYPMTMSVVSNLYT